MLVFRYWLTEKPYLMEKHMSEIAAINVNLNYPSHILGRFIAARLYFANARNEPLERILIDATKYHVAIMTKRGNTASSYPYFELAVCEALILTGHDEEGLEYIDRGKSFLAGIKGIPKHPFSIWENMIEKDKEEKILNIKIPKNNPLLGQQLNKRYA